MNKKVLVIGGGTAGMTASLELADQGIEVYLVEKTGAVGGKAINYSCKAAGRCSKCGACLPYQLKAKVDGHPGIKPIVNSEVKQVQGEGGKYKATIRFLTGSRGVDLGAETILEVSAVVAALGFDLFDASLKGEFGYGQHNNVITGFELEKALKQTGSVEKAFGPGLKQIGFIQCVGSRDLQAGNNYCSAVCCMYTGKLAKVIRQELPEAELDIFYMDLQTFGKDYSGFLKECVEMDKIRYIRGIPSKVFRYPYNYLTVRYADTLGKGIQESRYDLIVLASAMIPGRGLAQFAQIAGISLDRDGFLPERHKPGIFAAGACTGPKDIPQTISHAQAAAGQVIKFLNGLR